ncbi:MAG: gamma-glutamyltransferase family protein [Alphaproteobacteria bacterium]|nr:gamma-glutamyltransferase family protein [Alphaproteobacteria bacterium]
MRLQPMVIGHHYMASAGQYLATEAAHAVLQAGGNAIDAGVAGGIALGVVHSDQVQFSGVAPMLIHLAERGETVSIAGLGWWPKALDVERLIRDHNGTIPMGLLRTVVPAAPDAWLLALERYGTMSFGEVAAAAIRYARDGFAVHTVMATFLADKAEDYRRWPHNVAIWQRDGAPLKEGDRLVQADLGRTIQYMADQEKVAAAKGGRAAGLAAARDAFYRGDIAKTIAQYHRDHGGLLSETDLAEYRSEIEKPLSITFRGTDVLSCGPWCQGPVLLQMLTLLAETDLAALGHNSKDYVHLLVEVMNLCFADRERYYGDPRFVDVPMATLLSQPYARERLKTIRRDRAFGEMPPPGVVPGHVAGSARTPRVAVGEPGLPGDTSYVCVVDRHGNAFSATPSDVSWESPAIPGLGLCPSSRGSQSWADRSHTSAAAPGKRPRLTPNPAMAMRQGEFLMPFGAPGGDLQPQGMLQVLLNHLVFGMDIQQAVEAPRFITRNFPDSFEPHTYYPGRVDIEEGIGRATSEALGAMGHQVNGLPALSLKTAGVCAISADLAAGRLYGAADPRRTGRAMGW